MNCSFLRMPKLLRFARHGLLCLILGHAALNAAQAQAPVFNTLHSFNSYADGGQSQSDLVSAPDGTLYGTTTVSGTANAGTVYKVSGGVETTLHSFTGNPDGTNPSTGRLLIASDGNIYGTTYTGGINNDGIVFKITVTAGSPTTYSYQKLFDFNNANGQNPYGALIQGKDGALYGTTVYGGTNNYGAVYKITLGTAPALSLFYSFTNGAPNADGAHPHAGLIQATDGNFYGTTFDGGGSNVGTVFELTTAGVLTTTHVFANSDGANPEYGGLMQASDGKIYGTTTNGGTSGLGTIFQIGTGTTGTFHSLISFDNNSVPGYRPYSRLIQASDGKLYGTTTSGGTNGDGTVYRIATGTGNALSDLYSFQNTTDGNTPYGGLVQAQDGSLYGTTYYGGEAADGGSQRNYGVLYKITLAGALTPVFAFDNGFYDGYNPYGKLIQASDGNFYGTTRTDGHPGAGVIFKLTPAGAYTILHQFDDGSVASDGYYSQSKLLQARDGFLYGTTSSGGTFGSGVVFKISTAGVYTVLHNFPGGGNGATPYSGLVQGVGSDNYLYGTTQHGGTSNYGTVFKITTAGSITYLHTFTGGTDGAYPYAGVTVGSDGFLYGVTEQGGAIPAGPSNNGTFFKLSTAGDTKGYSVTPFTSNNATYPDGGAYPESDLLEVTPGVFYGTTRYGGSSGNGTVFSATSAGVIKTLHSFDGEDGYYPYAGLLLASDGNLYGSVVNSNTPNTGTLYSITPSGAFSLLYLFSPDPSGLGNLDGANPYGALIEGTDGDLYGMAAGGGTSNVGTIFQLNAYIPYLSGFTPASAGVGATVTLYGSHLTGTSQVKFGTGLATSFTVVSDTQLTAQVPSSAASGAITITTPHGTTSKAGFTLLTTPAPYVNTVAPNSGAPDTLVVLTGGNFTGATSVTFNGAGATFVIDSATQITATVPSNATTGRISITTPSGTGFTLNPFTVTASNAATITGFSPATGPVGSLVQITGTGFNSVSDVSFHGVTASFAVNSDTLITAIVPTGATTGTITVTTFDGTATSATSFTVAAASAPAITSFTPTQGVFGTLVQITGSHFTGAKSVKFHGISARFTVVSDTLISTKVPNNATTGTLSVTTSVGTGTSTGTFTVGPAITGFTPTGGGAGTTVVITGLNFTGTTSVKFGTLAAASFTVNSATQITAKAPTGVVTATLTVTTPVGTATGGTYYGPPAITSFTPTHAAVGGAVTITGTGFTGATVVKFNTTTAATFTVTSSTQITTKVPTGATTGKLSVTTPGGTAISTATFSVP